MQVISGQAVRIPEVRVSKETITFGLWMNNAFVLVFFLPKLEEKETN